MLNVLKGLCNNGHLVIITTQTLPEKTAELFNQLVLLSDKQVSEKGRLGPVLAWHQIILRPRSSGIKGMMPISLFQAFSLSPLFCSADSSRCAPTNWTPVRGLVANRFDTFRAQNSNSYFRSHTGRSCSLASFKLTRVLHLYQLYTMYLCSPSTEGLWFLSRFGLKQYKFWTFWSEIEYGLPGLSSNLSIVLRSSNL